MTCPLVQSPATSLAEIALSDTLLSCAFLTKNLSATYSPCVVLTPQHLLCRAFWDPCFSTSSGAALWEKVPENFVGPCHTHSAPSPVLFSRTCSSVSAQKPYFPLGSLRAQMLYPKSEDERYLTDSALESVLEEVQLGYLSGRYGGLDARRDWKDELSIGEQQVCVRTCGRGGARPWLSKRRPT